MLDKTRVRLHAVLEWKWILNQDLNLWNWEFLKKMNNSSMMTSGLDLTLLLMPLITSRPDNMLTNNAFGMKSHCSKVELWELNVTHRSLFLIILLVTQILLIHQKNPFHCVHWKISHIKSNILFNGPETILREFSVNHHLNYKNSTAIIIKLWQNYKNNIDKILQLWEAN